MFDAASFFKERLSQHIKEMSRYLRYIFNGHIAVALFFFIAAFAYFYQQWLLELPEHFPTATIMAIVFGLIANYSPVRTLLKEPDLVFLIVAEHKMGAYFQRALIYSYLVQLYVVFILVAGFGPLYFASFPERSGKSYLLFLVVLLIFKGWNLLSNWWIQSIQDKTIRIIDYITRFLLTAVTFYFVIDGELLLASVFTFLFIGVFLYDLSLSRKYSNINWQLLVDKDQHHMQSFYRIANMFADVPHLKNRIKKRHWLASICLQMIPFKQRYTYDFLYRITFLRSGDFLGMYIRLIIIGGLFIYFVPINWLKLIFAFLFLYMNLFQMMALYRHHRVNIWLDLYPVKRIEKKQALLRWMNRLGIIQTVIFTIIFLFMNNSPEAGIMIGGGMIFHYLFVYHFVRRKISV